MIKEMNLIISIHRRIKGPTDRKTSSMRTITAIIFKMDALSADADPLIWINGLSRNRKLKSEPV